MATYPLPFDEDRRQRVLDETGAIGAPRTPELDDLTALAADEFAAPCSNISLMDGERQWYASVVGPDMIENPRSVGFCAHTITQERPLVVLDAASDARFADNPAVTRGGIRFYAGAQVIVDGAAIGTFCLMDTEPRATFSAEEETRLRAFAGLVARWAEARSLARSARATLAERLRAEQARIEQASAERARFVSLVSHELRTPLNAILGFSDLLLQAGETLTLEERQDYLSQIEGGGRRMSELVESSLRFAATSLGDVTLDCREMSLSAAIEEAIASNAALARSRGCEVVLEDAAPDDRLEADPARCEQIVSQLLSNAIKFGPAGGRARIRLSRTQGGQVEVEVRDQGPGFSTLDLDTLTSAFGCKEELTTRRGEGLGLGLPLAYRLARLHGADLSFENQDAGASARLTFPAHRAIGRDAAVKAGLLPRRHEGPVATRAPSP